MSRWLACAATLSLVAVSLICTSSARAVDPVIEEFPLSTEGHRPQAIVPGPDGNLWVTEVLKHKILRVTPKGEITEFPVPGEGVGVLQGIAAGSDGKIYFTSREENAIRQMSTDGKFGLTFAIPSKATKPSNMNKGSWPREIAAGPDGSLYFAEMAANKIGKLAADGKITEYPIPTADAGAYGIVAGPDKKIWFTQSTGDKIGRLDPATGKIDEFDLSTKKALARDMCVGPDGAIWFSMNTADKIGRITMDGKVTEFTLAKGVAPIGIATGADGNLWFCEFKAGKMGRITPEGKVTEFDLPTKNAKPFCCCADKDGNIWVAEQENRIARLSPKTVK
jgi:virginiamycin B lyase